MRLHRLFICVALLSACATPLRKPANDEAPQQATRHFVFLIHGIGGDADTFRNVPQALQLQSSETETVLPSPLFYDTHSNEKDVNDFTAEVDAQIQSVLKEKGGLRPSDKISLIMHSQGGLVGTRWLFRVFKQDPQLCVQCKPHIYSFITLGTPFWGAKVAKLGSAVKQAIHQSQSKPNLLGKFGRQQLNDMSLTGDGVFLFRETFLNSAEVIKEITEQVQIHQIAGVATQLNSLTAFATGGSGVYEDDGAVPLPSARFDFWHFRGRVAVNDELLATPEGFQRTEVATDFHIVSALHASHRKEDPRFYEVAAIPSKCATTQMESCDHPTFPLLVQWLKGEKPALTRAIEPTSFLISTQFRFTKPVSSTRKAIARVSAFKNPDNVHLHKPLELYGEDAEWTDETTLRSYNFGYLDPGTSKAEVTLWLIGIGGKAKKMVVPVEAGMTTYLELEIEN